MTLKERRIVLKGKNGGNMTIITTDKLEHFEDYHGNHHFESEDFILASFDDNPFGKELKRLAKVDTELRDYRRKSLVAFLNWHLEHQAEDDVAYDWALEKLNNLK